jgi:hypothetical protein
MYYFFVVFFSIYTLKFWLPDQCIAWVWGNLNFFPSCYFFVSFFSIYALKL